MIQRRNRFWAAPLIKVAPIGVAMALIGCGGGGGGAMSMSGGGSPTTGHAGNAQFTYIGKPQAEVNGVSNQISYNCQAGASFTNFEVYPNPNLASTVLAFTRALTDGGDQIYTMPASGIGGPSLLTHNSISGFPSFTQARAICFLTDLGGNLQVESILGDGSQQKVLKANTDVTPTISPNGATLAYIDASGDIWTMPAAGGTATEIYSGGRANINAPVVWSANSSQIAFTAGNPATSTQNAFTMTSTGASVTNVSPSGIQNGNFQVTAWSPDGQNLACSFIPNGATLSGVLILSLFGGQNLAPTPSGFSDGSPCFSPDGYKLAFYRGSAGGATPGIYESDFAGTNPQLILSDPDTDGATGVVQSLVWSPFQQNVKFVGSGGNITAGPVAGYLMAQNGGQFASLMVFSANTPSTATITAPTPAATGSALMFTLGADSITNISFTNFYNGTRTSLSFSTTPAAEVSLDGSTGLVEFVAAGRFNKKVPTPSKGVGATTSYTGKFTAIYDATGKNLAPSGASTLEVDTKTGKLLSFQ